MRKCFKTILAFMLMLPQCFAAAAWASDSTVIYENGAEDFVFLPGGAYTGTDLFDGFKNVMPGDVATQQIIVSCNGETADTVKIYLRAVAHDTAADEPDDAVDTADNAVSMANFLEQLSMTVSADGTVIYEAAPDLLGGLEEDVCLGTFNSEEQTVELAVTLAVPETLGNEYANRIGEVDWVFSVEKTQTDVTPTPGSDMPKTGDACSPWLWAVLFEGSGSALGAVLFAEKRRRSRR